MDKHKRLCEDKAIDPEIIDDLSPEECKNLLAGFSKGLAHPARIEIIRFLANRPEDDRCLCRDIVEILPLAQSSVSQHLSILKETGWIYGEIDGPRVCYCITDGILEFHERLIKKCLA